MMNRRQFVGAAAASAALLSRMSGAHAAPSPYDVLIRGGRVIDPSRGISAIRDIAIAQGRIVGVEPSILGTTAETIDARGKIVIAGMIDLHTHCGRARDVAPLILSDGVTCWVDAGSNGADKIDESVANAKAAPNMGRVLVNLARTGILPEGDLMDISRADVGAARAAIERHRDTIVGVKARLSFNVAGSNDLEAMRRCQAVTMPFNLPVMVHVGQNVSPMPKILELLKPAMWSRISMRRNRTASSTATDGCSPKFRRRAGAASGSISATARTAMSPGTWRSAPYGKASCRTRCRPTTTPTADRPA